MFSSPTRRHDTVTLREIAPLTIRKATFDDITAVAALPVAGLTAWQALFDRGGLERGQTVLIAGAAGGVGHLAVQFGRHAGARVVGTGSARNRDFVLGLDADEFLDYTARRTRRRRRGARGDRRAAAAAEARRAHELSEARHVRGKIVLTVGA